MTTTQFVNRIAASAASLLLFTAEVALPASEVVIFAEPPAAERLAEILYAPRYRNATAADDDTAERFGMLINFEFDSTRVLPDSLPLLDSVGEMLNLEKIRKEVLVIEGHADASGTEPYNEKLSVRRAQAIKSYLVASYDVDPGRLVTMGHGEKVLYDASVPTNPINRRVEFRSLDAIVVN